ncbi:MAG: hypothetical protein M3O07_04235, partial [Pseudomonadota bacterium]|nr:hypothetical protein [Pseudomonadota bacterium]
VTTTPEQLERWVASLPHDVQSGIARDLDQTGEAHRFESSGHCAYYLRRQRPGAMIWRWGYVGSEREATRIRTFVQTLGAPLDPHRANQVFERATRRSVGNPQPLGISLLAPEIERLQTLVPVP